MIFLDGLSALAIASLLRSEPVRLDVAAPVSVRSVAVVPAPRPRIPVALPAPSPTPTTGCIQVAKDRMHCYYSPSP